MAKTQVKSKKVSKIKKQKPAVTAKASKKTKAAQKPQQKTTQKPVQKAAQHQKMAQQKPVVTKSPIVGAHVKITSKEAKPLQKGQQKVSEKRMSHQNDNFRRGQFVVYPKHGLGKITGTETKQIGAEEVRLFVIEFSDQKMKVSVPVSAASRNGLRPISSRNLMKNALEKLKEKARIRRTMWSRRAQEYELRIKSGDPVSIAQVVRELYRKDDQAEQSYSERQIFQTALDRLASEYAAVENIDLIEARDKLTKIMEKAA